MMKAVLQFRAGSGFQHRVKAMETDWLAIDVVDPADRQAFAGAMTGCDVLFHVLDPVTADTLGGAPQLRLIQKIGVGVNTIDLAAAGDRGIAVCNMPGTNSQAVAEMTLLLMMAALRRLPDLDTATRRGDGWRIDADLYDHVGEVGGRTIGLVGFGAVPAILAPVLKALGADVIYCATAPKESAVARFRPLPDLLAEADVVSLHVPQAADTERMIDAGAIGRMKPGAVLVNTARGGLIDETAVAEALRTGRLAALGTDVFAAEPAAADNPLFGLDNVVTAPHVAWLTPETLTRSLGVAVENCRRLRDGTDLLNRVL